MSFNINIVNLYVQVTFNDVRHDATMMVKKSTPKRREMWQRIKKGEIIYYITYLGFNESLTTHSANASCIFEVHMDSLGAVHTTRLDAVMSLYHTHEARG